MLLMLHIQLRRRIKLIRRGGPPTRLSRMPGELIIEGICCGLRPLNHLLPTISKTVINAAINNPPALIAGILLVKYLLIYTCRHLLMLIMLLLWIREKSWCLLGRLLYWLREFHWMVLVGSILLPEIDLWLLLLLRIVLSLLLIWCNLLQVLLVTRLKIGRLKLVVPVIYIKLVNFVRQGIS